MQKKRASPLRAAASQWKNPLELPTSKLTYVHKVRNEEPAEVVNRMTSTLRERLFQKKKAFSSARMLMKVPQSPQRRELSHAEFRYCLGPERLNAGFTEQEVGTLIASCDTDQRGKIQSHDFIRMVLQPTRGPSKAQLLRGEAEEGTIRREGTILAIRRQQERRAQETSRLAAQRRSGFPARSGAPSSLLFQPSSAAAAASAAAPTVSALDELMRSSGNGGAAGSSPIASTTTSTANLRGSARARRKREAEQRIKLSSLQREAKGELQHQAKLSLWADHQLSVVQRSTEMDKQTFIRSLYTGKGGAYGSNLYAQRNYHGAGSLW
jgi:hypothetical protein